MSPHEVLGLSADVSDPADVRRAYARTIRVLRPDTDPEGFLRAREAKDVLLARLAAGTVRAEPDDERSPPDATPEPDRSAPVESELDDEIRAALGSPSANPAIDLGKRLLRSSDGLRARLAAVLALATRIAVVAPEAAEQLAESAWSAAPGWERTEVSLDELDRRVAVGRAAGPERPAVQRCLWKLSIADGTTEPDLGVDRMPFLRFTTGRERDVVISWILDHLPRGSLRASVLGGLRRPAAARVPARKKSADAGWVTAIAIVVLLVVQAVRASNRSSSRPPAPPFDFDAYRRLMNDRRAREALDRESETADGWKRHLDRVLGRDAAGRKTEAAPTEPTKGSTPGGR